MMPIATDQVPAPEHLLNIIRCNSKLSFRYPCGGWTCSCRSNGLKCVAADGDYRGDSCHNLTEVDFVDDCENAEGNVFDFLQQL